MAERKWVMTGKEIHRCCVVRETIEGGLTVRGAAIVLLLSERQVYRLKKKVRDGGPVGVIHGNRGRSPSTAKSPSFRERIRALYQDKLCWLQYQPFYREVSRRRDRNIAGNGKERVNVLWVDN